MMSRGGESGERTRKISFYGALYVCRKLQAGYNSCYVDIKQVWLSPGMFTVSVHP